MTNSSPNHSKTGGKWEENVVDEKTGGEILKGRQFAYAMYSIITGGDGANDNR